MHGQFQEFVRNKYRRSAGDFTALFQQILAIAGEIGSDAAWKLLENCVIEKRLAWLDTNLETSHAIDDPIVRGYATFYETYLGVRTPDDGQIVEATHKRLVTRWWNYCPTLEACKKLGLDTREICRKAYHEPVQAFLSRIDPRLRFYRNYGALGPFSPYCEEVIELTGD